MSAIYGAIFFNNNVPADCLSKMQQAYEGYKIDRFSNLRYENVIMGCGIQHILPEAKLEVLPYEDDDYIFTADAMVDNMPELANKLSYSGDLIDGKMLFLSFKKWGLELGEHVRGIYAASIYDKRARKIYLLTDLTGSRCVFYRKTKDAFYFSTLIRPILNASPDKIELSEEWLAYWGSNCTAEIYTVPDLSPFEGVLQLEAYHYISVDSDGTNYINKEYWNPKKHYKRLKVSDAEGLDIFRKTFERSVRDVIRDGVEYGATLSSGLDSSSVSCVAAKVLNEKNRNLYSYTSVPVDNYESDGELYYVPNEKNGVLRLADEYHNIVPAFVSCENKDAITDIERLVPLLELPYKSAVNLVWIDEIYRLATSERNVGIVLKGQYGNGTISYGTLMNTVYQLLKNFRLKKAYDEICKFGKRRKFSKKYIIKNIAKIYYETRHRNDEEYYKEAVIEKHQLSKYKVNDKWNKVSKKYGNMVVDKHKQYVAGIWSTTMLNNIGSFDTRLGLIHGIILRDPAKDVRIMKLCCELPVTCFAGNGYERRLVREGMRGIVPNAILDDINHRGLQGADFARRIINNSDTNEKVLYSYVNDRKIDAYLDKHELKILRERLEEYGVSDKLVAEDERVLIRLLVIAAFAEFVERFS